MLVYDLLETCLAPFNIIKGNTFLALLLPDRAGMRSSFAI